MAVKFSFSGRGFWPWFLASLVMLLAIGDVLTTRRLINTGLFREGNPLMAWLMTQIGAGWVAVKLVVTAGILAWLVGRWSPLARIAMLLALVGMAFVVGRHVAFILWSLA